MKSLIYISFAALAFLSSSVAYANNSQRLSEDELSVVITAVCESSGNANESAIENAVSRYADNNVDSDTLETMQELATQFLVLPETAMNTICGY